MNLAIDLPPEKMVKAQTLFVFSLQSTCLAKCVVDYRARALSPGEELCTDRCVQKYYAANDRLSKMFMAHKSSE